MRIGGGAALAARWQHRECSDVDLWFYNLWDPAYLSSRIDQVLSDLGGSDPDLDGLDYHRADQSGATQIIVVLPTGRLLPIVCLKARPIFDYPLSGEHEPITGLPLETNEEILAKKVYSRLLYAQRPYPRDLYDLAWAIRHEPRTWELAVSVETSDLMIPLAESLGELPPNWRETHLLSPVIRPADPELDRNSLVIVRDAIVSQFTRR